MLEQDNRREATKRKRKRKRREEGSPCGQIKIGATELGTQERMIWMSREARQKIESIVSVRKTCSCDKRRRGELGLRGELRAGYREQKSERWRGNISWPVSVRTSQSESVGRIVRPISDRSSIDHNLGNSDRFPAEMFSRKQKKSDIFSSVDCDIQAVGIVSKRFPADIENYRSTWSRCRRGSQF